MKIEVRVRTNLVGSKVTDVIELPDDSTDEEIETAARDAMFNMIEWDWCKVDSEESK